MTAIVNPADRPPSPTKTAPAAAPAAASATASRDNPAPVRALLFDLDDTLWPIVPVIVAAEQALYRWLQEHAPAVAAAHSVESLRARRMALIDQDPRHGIDLMALRALVMTEAFEAHGEDLGKIAAGMELFGQARNRVQPFDDVLPALQRLGQKYLLGSVSNGAADLAAIGMARHFRISVAAHEFGSLKPDPAIFLHACQALGVAPAEAVYIGDDPAADVIGAQQAGMRTVWINRFERVLPSHIRPDASCASLEQLETWLASIRPMQDAQGA
ncbi:MAG TPA: HAD family hydrolase [Herbaspirillum sp.]|jgi:putative hydrolase of the HAD superfamily